MNGLVTKLRCRALSSPGMGKRDFPILGIQPSLPLRPEMLTCKNSRYASCWRAFLEERARWARFLKKSESVRAGRALAPDLGIPRLLNRYSRWERLPPC